MKILWSPEADKTQVHPLVRTLDDGRRALFINPTYTLGVEGFTEAESAALLAFLFKHMMGEQFIYRHRWSANMLTMWDNRRAMHNATGGYDGHRRVMHRTTVAGARPI
jgi:taurine dioxygenase